MPKEKRRLQRFRIGVPAHIEVCGDLARSIHMDLLSWDVCADGAFFLTPQPLATDTPVRIRMQLVPQKLTEMQYGCAQITLTGTVLRTNRRGMAIRFDRNYQISPVASA